MQNRCVRERISSIASNVTATGQVCALLSAPEASRDGGAAAAIDFAPTVALRQRITAARAEPDRCGAGLLRKSAEPSGFGATSLAGSS